MRWLFERLDTSPGQEKVFVKAADELTEAFEKLRDEWAPPAPPSPGRCAASTSTGPRCAS